MKGWNEFVLSDKKIDDIPTQEILAWMSDDTMPSFIHSILAREVFKRKGLN